MTRLEVVFYEPWHPLNAEGGGRLPKQSLAPTVGQGGFMSDKFLRRRVVEEMTGKSRSAIYADPDFPQPVRIGERAVAWRLSDIEAWMADRPLADAQPFK